MSTPPKPEQPRIHKVFAPELRSKTADAGPAESNDMPFAPAPEDDGFGSLNLTGEKGSGQTGEAAPEPKAKGDLATELAAIEAEGLTARQLRMARRIAFKQGIEAASDFEAVLLLRRKGINPFQRRGMLSVVENLPNDHALVAQTGKRDLTEVPANPPRNLPLAEVDQEAQRAYAIMQMQRDIARRRRHNLALLMSRLFFFILLPTIFAGYYYCVLATPLYATKSEFLVQQAEAPGGGASLSSLFRGTQFATSQDAITVQSFLQSRDAMMQLDKQEGFKAHFSQSFIDPLQRLDPNATNEAAYKLYRRNVTVSYDPTEGIIRMEVVAADPATSERFARALLKFAEHQVDQLTQRVREDQMKGARESYADAETKVQAAQKQVSDLQEKLGVLDPKIEAGVAMNEISALEGFLRQKRLELQQLLDNAKPNKARVDGAQGDIARLQQQVDQLRASLTENNGKTASLAQVTGQMQIAQTELQTRQMMLGQSLQQLETARIEANRQVRYLTLGVVPVAPDEPTYPRKFENTALAFLIFAGIYLMLSLTASILREQVTS